MEGVCTSGLNCCHIQGCQDLKAVGLYARLQLALMKINCFVNHLVPGLCRQALRNKASLWTSSEQQPPLFYFLREDTLRYMNKVGLSSGLLAPAMLSSDGNSTSL